MQQDALAYPEAEAPLLGSVMIDPDQFYAVLPHMKAEYFYFVRNGYVWEAIIAVNKKGLSIDNLTVALELEARNRLDEVGGHAYISECINVTPTSQNALSYAALIKSGWDRRQLMNALSLSANVTADMKRPVIEIKEQVLKIIDDAAAEEMGMGHLVSLRSLADKGGDRALDYKYNQQEVRGIPTGIGPLDRAFGGIRSDDFVVMCGLTSSGKSTLVLQMILNMPGRGLVFPTETNGNTLIDRMACFRLGIDFQSFQQGKIDIEDSALLKVYEEISDLPIAIYDKAAPSPLEIKAYTRQLARKGLVDWVVVDGINDIAGPSDLFEKTSEAAQALYEIVYDGIPVIATCHADRSSTQRATKEPTLYDVQGSIRISQLCTRFIGIHREGYEYETGLTQTKPKNPNDATLRIGKDRPTGQIGKIIPVTFVRGKRGYRFEAVENRPEYVSSPYNHGGEK